MINPNLSNGKTRFDAQTFATILANAWNGESIESEDLMDAFPTTLNEVYSTHAALENIFGKSQIGGYKLGGTGAALESDGSKCVAIVAPLLKQYVIIESKAYLSQRELRAFAIEAEIGFVMKESLPWRNAPYSENQVLAAIDYACLTLEVVGTRFRDSAKAPGLSNMADCICAGGVVIGAARIPVERVLGSQHQVSLLVNNKVVASGSTSLCPTGTPLGSLCWAVNKLSQRKVGLERGHLVITGKCCVTDEIKAGDRFSATFGSLGTIHSHLR